MFKVKIKIYPNALIFFLIALCLSPITSLQIPFRPVSINKPPHISKDYSIVNTIIYPSGNALPNSVDQEMSEQPQPADSSPPSYEQIDAQLEKRQFSKDEGDDDKIAWINTQKQLIRDYVIDAQGKEVELTPTRPTTRQKGKPLPREPRQTVKNIHSSFKQFPTLQRENSNTKRPLPPLAKQRHTKKLNFQQIGNYIIIIIMAIVTFITFIALCTRNPQQQTEHLQRKHRLGRQSIPQSEQQQPQQQQDEYLQSSIIIIKRQSSLH